MLRRSSTAKKNKAIFFRHVNDIDIFVEDTSAAHVKIYQVIFDRALHGKVKIKKIFPCGSRKDVIKSAANARDEGRIQIFFIDADLNLSLANKVKIERVIEWDKYCLENHFLQEKSTIKVIDLNSATLQSSEIEEKLNFNQWLSSTSFQLIDIFSVYTICHKYKLSVPTVSYSGMRLCKDNSPGELGPEKCSRRLSEVMQQALSNINTLDFLYHYTRQRSFLMNRTNCDQFISAKDYLLPLLLQRLRVLFGVNFKKEIFLRQTAEHINIDDIESVIQREIERQQQKLQLPPGVATQ